MNSKELNANIRKTIDARFESEQDVENQLYDIADLMQLVTPHHFYGWFEGVQLNNNV